MELIMEYTRIRNTVMGCVLLLMMACSSGSRLPSAVPPTPLTPGQAIPLTAVTTPDANLADPNDPGWHEITEYMVETAWAPAIHPSVNLRNDAAAPTEPVNFRVARDEERFYVRVHWSDGSNDQVNSFDRFADAAAVQFALDGGSATPYTMGAPGAPVNIWYWRAGEGTPQDLAAGGFGSTTRLKTADLSAEAAYDDTNGGEWTLVFSRTLSADGEYQANFLATDDIHLTLAVWQGADAQRDGRKRTTIGWIVVRPDAALAVARR
jgi:DMSO reductase family type II enzyme heme b subunit